MNSTYLYSTGASEGIGKSAAIMFAEQGCKLVLIGRKEHKLLDAQKEILEKYRNTKIHLAVCDVGVESDCEKTKKDLPEEFATVDILVNNAGYALGARKCIENEMKDVKSVIDTNFLGVVKMTTLFLPDMVKRNSGHIIMTGSIAGHQSYPNGSIYCASKFALKAYTDSLRMELIETKVRVGMVSPGLVETNFSVVRFFGDKEKAQQVYKGFKPLVGDDIADNIMYIATRPEHVQIADIIVFPTNQASVYHIYKNI
jgi:3-hydroxy acid dehydrogenase/malonic semialdehyde reductase